MQIRVLTEKPHVAERYECIAKFFLKQLLTEEELKTITVNISFVSIPDKLGKLGYSFPYQEKAYATEYMVQLNRNLTSAKKVATLAHELAHIKQYVRNELRSSDTGKTFFWMGKSYRLKTIRRLTEEPWEVDADEWETKLYNEWLKVKPKKKKYNFKEIGGSSNW